MYLLRADANLVCRPYGGRLMSSSLQATGESLVQVIGAVVCLSSGTTGPVVRYSGLWMAA